MIWLLGFGIVAFAIFNLVTENAHAAANIANHTPEQLAQWKNFAQVYETHLHIAITTPNAFTKNRALQFKDAFISYVKSFPGQDGAADKLSLAIDKEITLSNLPD